VGRMMKAVIRWFLLAGTMFANPFTGPTVFPQSFDPSSKEKIHDLGGRDVKMISALGPVSYSNPAGIPVTASLFGWRALEWWFPVASNNVAYDLSMDATGNIHVSTSSAGTEVANATNLSGTTFFILAAGIR
jgi:hypothetical protein